MSESKVKKMKKEVKVVEKEKEKINLPNALFEFFIPGSGANNILIKLKSLCYGSFAMNLLRFCKKIQLSSECQAYIEKRSEVIKQAQEKAKEEKMGFSSITPFSIPEWGKIINEESGLMIEKFEISMGNLTQRNNFNQNLNANEMEALESIFEFVD